MQICVRVRVRVRMRVVSKSKSPRQPPIAHKTKQTEQGTPAQQSSESNAAWEQGSSYTSAFAPLARKGLEINETTHAATRCFEQDVGRFPSCAFHRGGEKGVFYASRMGAGIGPRPENSNF